MLSNGRILQMQQKHCRGRCVHSTDSQLLVFHRWLSNPNIKSTFSGFPFCDKAEQIHTAHRGHTAVYYIPWRLSHIWIFVFVSFPITMPMTNCTEKEKLIQAHQIDIKYSNMIRGVRHSSLHEQANWKCYNISTWSWGISICDVIELDWRKHRIQ